MIPASSTSDLTLAATLTRNTLDHTLTESHSFEIDGDPDASVDLLVTLGRFTLNVTFTADGYLYINAELPERLPGPTGALLEWRTYLPMELVRGELAGDAQAVPA